MKSKFIHIKLLVIILACFLSSLSYSETINNIVVFGDSLSDNGNFYALSKKLHVIDHNIPIAPISPPYYAGRFSNGPTWAEDLAQNLHAKLFDYAYGGAWAQSEATSHQIIPGLTWQIDTYLVRHASMNQNTLYIIWIGANDYLNNTEDFNIATNNVVDTTKNAMHTLIAFGAQHILLINLPDLGQTPTAVGRGPAFATSASKLSSLHNQKLLALVQNEQKEHLTLQIQLADVASVFTTIINDPKSYGLTNVSDYCYDGGYDVEVLFQALHITNIANFSFIQNLNKHTEYTICQNSDDYLFWDHVHPTAKMHGMIARFIQSVLQAP